MSDEVPCKTDPRAPHGFVRNASHTEDRYVCECELWEPPEIDVADIIAGALQTSRGHAYELMQAALDARDKD